MSGAGKSSVPGAGKPPMRMRDAWSVSRNLRYLLRPAPGSFKHVDGLRALANLWMISYHTLFYAGVFVPERYLAHYGHLVQRPILRLVEHGQVGLDIFFAISGFLIAHLLLVEHRETGTILVRRFYVRRALRLLPAYTVGLLVYCLTVRVNCDTVWANILYVNNFLPVTRQCMTWTWSLAIEEQFYIIFPAFLIVLLRLRRFRASVFVGLLALSLVIRWFIVHRAGFALPMNFHPRLHGNLEEYAGFFDALYDKPYTRYGGLLAGVVLAYVYNRTDFIERFSRLRFASLIGLVSLGACFTVLLGPDLYFSPWNRAASTAYLTGGRLVFAAATCGVVALCLSATTLGKILSRLLSARIWYPFAQLSYSAYLLHPIVIIVGYAVWLRPQAFGLWTLLVYYVIFTTITHLLALLMYLGVERPVMNLRRHPRVLRWERAPSARPVSREDRSNGS